jgi:hypothetical protein
VISLLIWIAFGQQAGTVITADETATLKASITATSWTRR